MPKVLNCRPSLMKLKGVYLLLKTVETQMTKLYLEYISIIDKAQLNEKKAIDESNA